MKLKVLFLTVIIILAIAGVGSIWVWQKGEDTTPLPMVDNEPENGTPDIHTDGEVIEPRTNPETGWKIFEHPDVPITFEYPGEFVYKGIDINKSQGFTAVGFETDEFTITLILSAEGKGLENIQINTFDHAFLELRDRKFLVPLLEYEDIDPVFMMLSIQATPPLDDYGNLLTPFRIQLRCKSPICHRGTARSILERITMSIRISSDSR